MTRARKPSPGSFVSSLVCWRAAAFVPNRGWPFDARHDAASEVGDRSKLAGLESGLGGRRPASSSETKLMIAGRLEPDTAGYWPSVLRSEEVWFAPVLDWRALITHNIVFRLGMLQTVCGPYGARILTTRSPIRIDGGRPEVERAPPLMGERTAETREEFGLSRSSDLILCDRPRHSTGRGEKDRPSLPASASKRGPRLPNDGHRVTWARSCPAPGGAGLCCRRIMLAVPGDLRPSREPTQGALCRQRHRTPQGSAASPL
jgi:hypothetical protein